MKSLQVGDTELWYEDRGQGMPLLLVHGFPLNHSMWAAQIDALPSSRVRVLAPDLRGFGRSPVRRNPDESPSARPPEHEKQDFLLGGLPLLSMEQFADDLALFLDGLGIQEPVVLCGLSMGGYIAFQFQRKYAERLRGLILCDTRAVADKPEAAAARRQMADRVLREGIGSAVDAMVARLLSDVTMQKRQNIVEEVRHMMLSTAPEVIAATQRGMALRPDSTAVLGQIACPTLVVVGCDDVGSPPSEMHGIAEAIPCSRFAEIPEAGHLSPLENPAAVNAAITDFLATV